MVAIRRRVSVLCMAMTFFVCVLMAVSWNFGRSRSGRPKIRIPSERFWRRHVVSKSVWNQEQQRLDFIHNPLLNSSAPTKLPDWLNDTAPVYPCEPDYGVSTRLLDYNILPQSLQDFLVHRRCRTYPMLINQLHVCNENPFLLLVVKSLVPHFDRRQAIRETWGRVGVFGNRTVATVFLLGNTLLMDHFPNLLGMLSREAELHKDLLQWDYRDTFFNLTLKEVLFLEWFSQKCPRAQYVLKGDDDVFVNTFRVIDFLEGLSEDKDEDFFVGDVISNATPHRDKKLKYFIPESVFEGRYPPYAGGGGYLYSGELALRLYNVSRQVALYPIDDVYTGMCLKRLGLVPKKHDGFKTFGIKDKYRDNPCTYRGLMLVHSRTPQEVMKIWPWITDPELDCQ